MFVFPVQAMSGGSLGMEGYFLFLQLSNFS